MSDNAHRGAMERSDSPPSTQPAIVPAAPVGQPLGVASRRPVYRMLNSIDISNFRSFEKERLTGFKTINIIVGPSASVKTALLEAMRMALAGTPTVAYQLGASRGVLAGIPFNPSREVFESAWSSLFFDFQIDRTISFLVRDSKSHAASLKIYFDEKRPVTPSIQETAYPGLPVLTSTIVPVAFERLSFTGDASTLYGTVNPQQQGSLLLEQGPEIGTATQFFAANWQTNAPQVAAWYSQLRINNRGADIPGIVREQFADIEDLTTEAPHNVASIYASMKYRSKKIPVSLVSSGLNKFIALMVAIRTFRGGVLLVDEIENGIFYKMFPAFWRALHSFAVDNQTQLFLSTHSWECLKAASELIEKHEDDFTLVQVAQYHGCSSAVVVSGREAGAAIEEGIEVRK